MEEKNKWGRPLKFKSVEELESKMKSYFNETKIEEWTITWLAVYLDTSRETLINYQKRDEYFDTIKKGKDKIEYAYELSLRKRWSSWDIFWLKNFGWVDKIQTDNTTNHTWNITIWLPEAE